LQPYHDQELPVAEQIAMSTHLGWCKECAAGYSDLQLMRAGLRATVPGHPMSQDEAAVFTTTLVSRLNAERDGTWVAHMRVLFEDWHLVYAGLGAAAATALCIVAMLGVMQFGANERPDSLAALVNFLATPGSNENPVAVDGRILLPRALGTAFSTSESDRDSARDAEEDAVFTLAAVVTREGRIANLELLRGSGAFELPGASDAKLVEGLLDAVSRARFEPARMAGLPVAVNMVWLVAHTTVRASKNVPPLDFAKPALEKKRGPERNRVATDIALSRAHA
jgi:hypothetical protein